MAIHICEPSNAISSKDGVNADVDNSIRFLNVCVLDVVFGFVIAPPYSVKFSLYLIPLFRVFLHRIIRFSTD